MTSILAEPIRRSPSPFTNNNRLSTADSNISSSVASYRTAPTPGPLTASQSQLNPSSSTVDTVSPQTDLINPMHHLAADMASTSNAHASKEVHVVKVTSETVRIEVGPIDPPFYRKFGQMISSANQSGPLPSPPASDDGMERDMSLPNSEVDYEEAVFDDSKSVPAPCASSPEFTSAMDRMRAGTLPILSEDVGFNNLSTSAPAPLHRSSTEVPVASSSRQIAPSSIDGYLHPPPPPISVSISKQLPSPASTSASSNVGRPTRRNTTGSFRPGHQQNFPSTSHLHFSTTGDSELASDIQLAAEQIRRERASKRVREEQAAEKARERQREERDRQEVPLVGNLIGKDHVNYVLMYNMLTGIRIGVSRCQAKMKRPLTDDDFKARHKFSFDIVGNEVTPSTTYDFKFKDYAPWIFRYLRDLFGLDAADYLLSLTSKYILSELGSPGKSGSFFYFSSDYRFIIKTIRKEEAAFLRRNLKRYYEHVLNNPHTLISRFYGLHRVKLPHGKKIHFVIMNNLFPPHRDIHETYDLKGSTVGRLYPEEKLEKNPRAVLKDMNWIKRGKVLELGPEKRALLTEQLRRDKEFLKEINVMDYSLLVGIHEMRRGNSEGVRGETLKVFSPEIPLPARRATQGGKSQSRSPEAAAMRRAMRSSDPKRLGKGKGTIKLPETDVGDKQREGFIFYQDEGGLRATDEANEEIGPERYNEAGKIYYLGIIDILTPYNSAKKVEHIWKGLKDDRHKISPVPPPEYADRFFSFMKAIMRGGGGGESFVQEKDKERDGFVRDAMHDAGRYDRASRIESRSESRRDLPS